MAGGAQPYVHQISAPTGWHLNTNLRTGSGNGTGSNINVAYSFQIARTLVANTTYRSTSTTFPFMITSTADDDLATSAGYWQVARDNPPVSQQCGLDYAVLMDLSGSIGTQLPKAKAALHSFVDALAGTPSRVALFSFDLTSPAENGANLPVLRPVRTSAERTTIKNQYANWAIGSGTNWDAGLYRVATAQQAPDAQARPARWRLPVLAVIVAVLALAGLLTVLYPTVAAWFHQYEQSQVIDRLSGEVEQLPAEGLATALADAHAYNDALLGGGALLGSYQNVPEAETVDAAVQREAEYSALLAADSSGLMARVKIPAIEVDLPIYHGTSDAVLLRGVGHLEGTALPVGGDETHAVLTAHRGLADAELFTHLDQVAVGDTFTIEAFREVLTYQVRQTQVVDPSETEKLYPMPGEDLVTLSPARPWASTASASWSPANASCRRPRVTWMRPGRPPTSPGSRGGPWGSSPPSSCSPSTSGGWGALVPSGRRPSHPDRVRRKTPRMLARRRPAGHDEVAESPHT